MCQWTSAQPATHSMLPSLVHLLILEVEETELILLLLLLLILPFNGLFSRTNWVSRHQKRKPFWILLEQEMTGWQWHQLIHMQIICTSLETDNHASTSPLSFYRLDALPAVQPTVSKHWRKAQAEETEGTRNSWQSENASYMLLMPLWHQLTCTCNSFIRTSAGYISTKQTAKQLPGDGVQHVQQEWCSERWLAVDERCQTDNRQTHCLIIVWLQHDVTVGTAINHQAVSGTGRTRTCRLLSLASCGLWRLV